MKKNNKTTTQVNVYCKLWQLAILRSKSTNYVQICEKVECPQTLCTIHVYICIRYSSLLVTMYLSLPKVVSYGKWS